MPVRSSHLALLRPYLVGEEPTRRERPDEEPQVQFEWDMHCPLHEDFTRSAQMNVTKGVWFCQKGCGGGKVKDLVKQRSEWVTPPNANMNGHSSKPGKVSRPKE
jgi:hypothetical protein